MTEATMQQDQESYDEEGPRSPLKVILITAIITMVVLAAVGLGGLWVFQDRLIYPGSGAYVAPKPGWTEAKTEVPGVGAVTTYELAPKPGKPTVLFFHGNGYGYEGSIKATEGYVRAGMGIVIPEFPGYAGNPGSANEDTLKALGTASAQRLLKRGVKPEDLVVIGNSIGTGPAISAAMQPNHRLIIISGLDDLANVARDLLPFIPASFVHDRWNNARSLADVKTRVTVVHAPDDTVIPFAEGQALAKAAKSDLIVVPAGHQLVFDGNFQDALAVSILR